MTVGPMTLAQVGAVTGPGTEFFDRARQRLTLEVPAALPAIRSSTARNGASSTRIPHFSTGVTRK